MSKYPDEKTYNKLIRDHIPEIIEKDGKIAETRTLPEEEFLKALKEKLLEEGQELLEVDSSNKDETIKEMSDVLEILRSMAEKMDIEMSEIEKVMEDRAKKRGRFKKKLFLERTRKA